MKRMIKGITILGMIMVTIVMLGMKKECPSEVIEVDPTTYAEIYTDKIVYKECDTEIECAEQFSEAWYKVHKDDVSERTLVEVIEENEKEIKLIYTTENNGIVCMYLKYDNELLCSEVYSEIWYYIHGNN